MLVSKCQTIVDPLNAIRDMVEARVGGKDSLLLLMGSINLVERKDSPE